METTIKASIVATVDKKSFKDGVNFARDTGKEIDQNLRRKLELDIATAQQKLIVLKKNLKEATTQDQKIQIQIETNNAKSELTEFQRRLKNLQNTWDADLSRLQSKFNSVNDTIKKTWSSFSWLASWFQNIAWSLWLSFGIGWVVSLTQSIFWLVSAQQKYNAVLKNSLGTQEEATKSLELIREISSKTPFELNSLTESYIKLVNRWFKPTREEIISLWDLASSQGKQFDQLTEALLDAQTGEFERLKEFWVRASVSWDQVAFTFKWVTTTVQKTDESIRDYILSLWQLQWVSWWMAQQSKTLWWQFSNLLDSVTALWTSVWLVLAPAFATVIELSQWLVSWLQNIINLLSWSWNVFADTLKEIQDYILWYKDLNWNLTESWKEFYKNQIATEANQKAIEDNLKTINAFNATKIDWSQTRKEFEANKIKALEAANANIAFIKSQIEVQKSLWKVASAWNLWKSFWQDFWLLWKDWWKNLEKQLTDAQKSLKDVQSKIFAPAISTKASSTWVSKSWGSGQSAKQKAIDEEKKAQEKLLEERQKLAEKEKALLLDLANANKANSKAIYDSTIADITKVQDKIKWIDAQIATTKASIASLTASEDTSLAQRIVEINKELTDQNIEQEKKIALEKELALATANTTAEEIAKQTAISKESTTEKILRENAEKKAQLEVQLADLQTAKDTELAQLAILNQKKIALEQAYTTLYNQQIAERETQEIASINRIKQALSELKLQQSSSNNPWSVTNNNSSVNNNQKTIANTFVVNSSVDLNQAVKKVSWF